MGVMRVRWWIRVQVSMGFIPGIDRKRTGSGRAKVGKYQAVMMAARMPETVRDFRV